MTRFRRPHLGLLFLCSLPAGCADELGPVPLHTTRVTGVVVEGKRPVGGGFIEFTPTDGTVGNLTSAPLRHDGTFTADHVAVGTNQIGIVGAPVTIPGGRSLFETLRTTISRDITPAPSSPITIDLIDEFVRYQNRKPPAR